MLNISRCIVQASVRTAFVHLKSSLVFSVSVMSLFKSSSTVAYKMRPCS